MLKSPNKMAMMAKERRGSKLNKLLDLWVGRVMFLVLVPLIAVKRIVSKTTSCKDTSLVVCFGAIGDLILLTEAVRARKPSKQVVLVCSKLNRGAASIFKNVYSSTEIVDLYNPMSLRSICQKYQARTVFDSTQWANIGPVQAGIAKLLEPSVKLVGFKTKSVLRNAIYDQIVEHGRSIHEFLNFMNLLETDEIYRSNDELRSLLPHLYAHSKKNRSKKLLFHMWPSGNRSYLKMWPHTSWKELIEACLRQGYSIYLTGSNDDREKTIELANSFNSQHVLSLAGEYSLCELFQFISTEIEFVVSVNTGILHLAAATGVPVIGLHGGVNPQRWGPLGERSVPLLPVTGKSAYLHYGFEYPKDDHEAYVLDKLNVEQVLSAVSLLQKES